jgi:GAF domain-containing protein
MDTIAGEVFETGEPQLHQDVRVAANVANEKTPIRSELAVPLGDHGVFFMSSTITDDIDEADLALAKMLAANVEVALERAEHERLLHHRETELERQNERLDRFASVLSLAYGHTTGESGTSFGLAIVQRVVETHGWMIAVSEGSGSGARFDIEP